MLVNPLTGEKFPKYGMQPGMLSEQYKVKKQKDLDKFSAMYYAGTTKSKLTNPEKDAKKVGYTIFVGFYYVKKSKK